MPRTRRFRVLVATDGSTSARAAVTAAGMYPWPRGAEVHGVVARGPEAPAGHARRLSLALGQSAMRIAASARRALAHRWPDAEVAVLDKAPVDAILSEAGRLEADAIVLGWRGHGAFRRLLLGSVSRGVVRYARCPVLVVRRRRRAVRAFVVGVDGSVNAARAALFLAALRPRRGERVTVVRVEEPMSLPSGALLPRGIRATLRRDVAGLNAERMARAKRDVGKVAARLARSGWAVRERVHAGAPLDALLATVSATRADVLVVGARGASGVSRLLLGSVAEGALSRSPVPVLVVR